MQREMRAKDVEGDGGKGCEEGWGNGCREGCE